MQGFAAGIFTELRSLGRLSLIKVKFVKFWDSSGYSEIKKNMRPTCKKLAFGGKLSPRY